MQRLHSFTTRSQALFLLGLALIALSPTDALGQVRIVSWGRDVSGQVTNTPSGPGYTQVSGGFGCSLALRADSSIASWGADTHGKVTNSPGGTGFLQVAAGIGHSLALRLDNVGYAYCFGDGIGTACPCGASGNPGEGCANTSSVGGALLTASGNAYVLRDSFQLAVAGVPGHKAGLILRGASQLAGNPNGDGLLCTTGLTARSQVQVTSEGSTTFTHFQGSPFGASIYGTGVSTNYQFWYRDPTNTCSGSGFNFSNAWTVIWMP